MLGGKNILCKYMYIIIMIMIILLLNVCSYIECAFQLPFDI